MTTTHSPRPPARATRPVLATIAFGAVAAVLLTGCGSTSESPARPAAAREVTDPGASAGTSPSAAAADTGESLAGIDRALAELDHQLTDADHDVATPEGDIR